MDVDQKPTRARTPEIHVEGESEPQGKHSIHRTPTSSRGSTPEKSSPKHVKGTRAKFIRQNPRFINTPICQVLPCEGGKSVAECLEWKQEDRRETHQQALPQTTLDSTLRHDYRPPSPDTRPRPLQRFSPHKPTTSRIPFGHDNMEKGREKISFMHLYDCRADPNQPDRGKLHGSFVWEPLSKPSSPDPTSLHSSPSRASSLPL